MSALGSRRVNKPLKGTMKKYQARPIYRIGAGLIAILGWPVTILSISFGINEYFEIGKTKELWVGIGIGFFSLAMSFVAIKGELPKILSPFIRFPSSYYDENE